MTGRKLCAIDAGEQSLCRIDVWTLYFRWLHSAGMNLTL